MSDNVVIMKYSRSMLISPSLLDCLIRNGIIDKGLIVVISFLCFILIASSSKVVLACPEMDATSPTYTDSGNSVTNTTVSSINFLTFENSTLGIKMHYPSDWIYDISDNKVTFTPMAAGEPMFEHFMTITVGTNYSDYTLGPNEDLGNNLLENGSKFTVTPMVIAGHPAIKNEFTAFMIQQIPCPPPFPGPVSITNIYIPVGDKVYTIEYRNGTDSPGIVATTQQMIRSIEIGP